MVDGSLRVRRFLPPLKLVGGLHDLYKKSMKGRRGHDHMVVGFETACAISAYHYKNCEFELRSSRGVLDTTLCDTFCQRFATGFLWVLWFPPPIKLTATI
jgi:hypothetical protein